MTCSRAAAIGGRRWGRPGRQPLTCSSGSNGGEAAAEQVGTARREQLVSGPAAAEPIGAESRAVQQLCCVVPLP